MWIATGETTESRSWESQLRERDGRIADLDGKLRESEERVARLEKQFAELTERLGRNSAIRICRRRATHPMSAGISATSAVVTGVYHVSRRKAVEMLSDLLGVDVLLEALSSVEARVGDAVQPAADEAWERVGLAEVKHTDGTSWYQAGVMMALWTIATTAATVFKIVADSTKVTLAPRPES